MLLRNAEELRAKHQARLDELSLLFISTNGCRILVGYGGTQRAWMQSSLLFISSHNARFFFHSIFSPCTVSASQPAATQLLPWS